jgi:succinyl-CoA synthetase beta subunit
VVKAQVHAGGRGKAGGVKFVRTIEDVEAVAGRLLGSTLHTHQTGPEGVPIHALLIQDGVDIAKEYYLSCLVDRSKKRIIIIGSSEGGMDIEEVAAKTPEKILTLTVDPIAGVQPYQAATSASRWAWSKKQIDQLVKVLNGVYNLFVQNGRDQPADRDRRRPSDGAGRQGQLGRQRPVPAQGYRRAARSQSGRRARAHRPRASTSTTSRSTATSAAWSTAPAWRWRPWTSSSCTAAAGQLPRRRRRRHRRARHRAFKLICLRPQGEGILVNIFGGIVRCDTIAEGVITAVKEVGLGAGGGAPRGHQRRAGREDAGQAA